MRWKKGLQGLGLVYVLLLLTIAGPGIWQLEAPGGSTEELKGALSYVSASVTEPPKIALTFDDGPNAYHTPELLDGLKARGVKATFFLIGENVEKAGNDELLLRMLEEGHLIGNHTYHHVDISKVSDEEAYQEIAMTSELIYDITGEQLEYMRPPFGVWQKALEEKIEILPVMWTVDPLDWATENTDEIVNKVVTKVRENDIILLHDCYESSVKAALRIVDLLQAEGYEFVTVDQLIVN